MKRFFLLTLGVFLTATSVACQQTTPNLEPLQKAIGTVELTFDLANKTVNAAFTPNRSSTRAVLNPQNGVAFSSSSFQVITSAGTNFLNAKFNVSNTSGGTLTDLTLVAYQKSGNTASTALKNLQNFQGLSNAALDAYATSAKPTNGMTNATTVNTNLADLQLLTETEVSSLTTDAAAELQAGEYLFPYGFIARASGSTTSRAIANGSNTGSVTVGLKVPNSNEPSSAVYRFGMTFVVFSTPVSTRVAESLEEQVSSGAETRGNAGGFNTSQTVAFLGSSLLQNSTTSITQTNPKLVNACQVRTAGTAASPTAFLATAALTSTAGSFDQCFAASGTRQINSNVDTASTANGSEKILALAVQPDGKIVLSGFTTLTSSGGDFLVMRLNTDGSFDQSFGTGGKASFAISPGALNDQANTVLLQSDGKIVLGGCVQCNTASSDFAVIRVNANGTRDTSFATATSNRFTANGLSDQDEVKSMALETVGGVDYLVAAGFARENNPGSSTGNPSNQHGALFRLKVSDGTLDTGFGVSGFRFFSMQGNSTTPLVGTIDDFITGVVIDANNKIIVGGNDSGFNDGVIRFTTTGAWDIKATTTLTGGGISGVLLDGTNVIVHGSVPFTVGGVSSNDMLALKFSLPQSGVANGTLVNGWGNQGNGTTIITINSNSDTTRAAAFQSDGKIILAGRARVGGNGLSSGDTVLVRLNANGTLDTGFGTSGIVNLQQQLANVDEALATGIGKDGKIIIAGYERWSNAAPIQDDSFVLQFNP